MKKASELLKELKIGFDRVCDEFLSSIRRPTKNGTYFIRLPSFSTVTAYKCISILLMGKFKSPSGHGDISQISNSRKNNIMVICTFQTFLSKVCDTFLNKGTIDNKFGWLIIRRKMRRYYFEASFSWAL